MKKTATGGIIFAAALLFSACAAAQKEEKSFYEEKPNTVKAETTVSTAAAVIEAATTAAPAAPETGEGVPCADIMAEILSGVEMSSMAEVDALRLPMYLDCEIPEGTDFSMYICGSGGFADEVFIIKCEDSDPYMAAAEKRIESRIRDFRDYAPDEADKLEQWYSEYSGGYFIYAVTPDNGKCEEIFSAYTK